MPENVSNEGAGPEARSLPSIQKVDFIWVEDDLAGVDPRRREFRIRKREAVTTRPTDNGAAEQARNLALAGVSVVLTLTSGEQRLYGAEWAAQSAPNYYRVLCPRCRELRRDARAKSLCWWCHVAELEKRRTTRARGSQASMKALAGRRSDAEPEHDAL